MTGYVLQDTGLDDKAQNIVRLVDDNTLAEKDEKYFVSMHSAPASRERHRNPEGNFGRNGFATLY